MGKASRDKGARGELEVCHLAEKHGFSAQRTAPLQAAGTDDPDVGLSIDGAWIEVKRRERLEIEKWSLEAENLAPEGQVPMVAYRRSRQPWRISMRYEDWLQMQAELKELRG